MGSAGCNLSVHRADGRGKTLLGPVSVPVAVPEGQGEFSPSGSQPAAGAEVAEAEVAEAVSEQLEKVSGESEASRGDLENVDSPAETDQKASGDPAENQAGQVGKVVNVSGKVVEVQ